MKGLAIKRYWKARDRKCRDCHKKFSPDMPNHYWCPECRYKYGIKKDAIKKQLQLIVDAREAPYRQILETSNDKNQHILCKLYLNLSARYLREKPWYMEPEDPLIFLGCTLEEYKEYLEKQFTAEMNWDLFLGNKNALFQIKAKKTISSFIDLSDNKARKTLYEDSEKKKQLFEYTNFYPRLCKSHLK